MAIWSTDVVDGGLVIRLDADQMCAAIKFAILQEDCEAEFDVNDIEVSLEGAARALCLSLTGDIDGDGTSRLDGALDDAAVGAFMEQGDGSVRWPGSEY